MTNSNLNSGFRLTPPAGSRVAILGGAGAIGSALARALAADGCEVMVLDTQAALDQAANNDHLACCSTYQLDLTDETSIRKAFESVAQTTDGLDGFVNCAGFTTGYEPVTELAIEAWDQVYEVNLRGAFLTAKAAIPLLRAGNAASMVLISSVLGIETLSGYAHYGATKAGVLSLTRALAHENAPVVRVNAVAPGAVETPFLTGGTGRPQEQRRLDVDRYAKMVPMGRIAQVDDVVGPILFLLGDASRYMTGQALLIDGGVIPR